MASGARPRRGLSSPRPVAPAPFAADPPVCARVLWARLIALGGVFGMLPQAGHGAKAARRSSGHKAGGPPPQQPEAGTGKCELSSATSRAAAACGGTQARSRPARVRRPPMRFRAREGQPQGPGAGEGKQRASSPGFDSDGAEREPAVEAHLAEGARGERNQTNASAAPHFGRTTPICSHDSRRSVSTSSPNPRKIASFCRSGQGQAPSAAAASGQGQGQAEACSETADRRPVAGSILPVRVKRTAAAAAVVARASAYTHPLSLHTPARSTHTDLRMSARTPPQLAHTHLLTTRTRAHPCHDAGAHVS